ncbi:MAG: hypothetical protein PHF56_25075 [Desulfuromonadaceae bacterium]|nr:hypothetical protein [Desulfuromonadaceae bacterium]
MKMEEELQVQILGRLLNCDKGGVAKSVLRAQYLNNNPDHAYVLKNYDNMPG